MYKAIICTLIALIICVSCNTPKKKSAEHFKIAHELFSAENYNESLKAVDFAISFDSLNNDAIFLKGKLKYHFDFDEEAIQVVMPLLKRDFKIDTINNFIGRCYFSLGYSYSYKNIDQKKGEEALEKSIIFYNNSLKQNPLFYESYLGKQMALHNLERYGESLNTLNQAIRLFPDSILLISNRGVEKHFLGDNDGALMDLNKSIISNRLDSSDLANAYRFRGRIYALNDKLDQAIDDLTKAILYDSKNEMAYVTRGDIYRLKGLKDKACQDYRKAAELGLVSVYDQIKEYCNN